MHFCDAAACNVPYHCVFSIEVINNRVKFKKNMKVNFAIFLILTLNSFEASVLTSDTNDMNLWEEFKVKSFTKVN
jgi:hypothetical protein